ncbi:MAG: aspartate aminotransferase family protein, partial [Cohaesibacter sp.]|nr:aspartate aminotransferase family protein [Cohaesibacter sp.]
MTAYSRNKPISFDSHWMPFTANQDFAQNPRLVESAKGMHYRSSEGDQILDMTAGLWCCNLGHGREEIADAVHAQF